MASRFETLPQRRAIVDRRALADALAALPGDDRVQLRRDAVPVLRDALAAGRAEIARRLAEHPSRGAEIAASYAYLVDGILLATLDFTAGRLFGLAPGGEGLTLAAVGGYGRGEMAPFSDVDIAFLSRRTPSPQLSQAIEAVLYTLWDLGLKVGHSSRSLPEMIAMARGDLSVKTALLEGRYLWGDRAIYDEAARLFDRQVMNGGARAFVADKMAERDGRHARMGDSRYVVEPNLKEGKGGLRDLHTLFWIGKVVLGARTVPEFVEKGLLTPAELRQFSRAESFLWAVRCHLHLLAGRGEDRLTFDHQREVASRMRYRDRPGRSAVERFMQHYFLTARTVGTLTGLFLAHLDEQMAPRGRRFGLPTRRTRRQQIEGFVVDRGRLSVPEDGFFRADPVRLLELFALADRNGLEIHPLAMRQATRDSRLIDAAVRRDPRANALFLDVLTSPRDPATVLRWMSEADVLGRFVPDFRRVIAQMQFDMYHHYTVDEHSIRAVGLLARIESGSLGNEHPLATRLANEIVSRRVLRVAVFLHDIAKGRGGDHSILGAEVAERLCPRFGLSPAETETVVWLVRHHLAMSATAFKRDLSDYKTIADFADLVQSPERLRLLTLLTVVDIRAVGPGIWNGWKRQLLAQLYELAEELLRLGHRTNGRRERIEAKQATVAAALGWTDDAFERFKHRTPDSYWIAEPDGVLVENARTVAMADDAHLPLSITTRVDPERTATLVTLYAADHPGLFARVAGAIHVAGGSVIDARIHTTRDGMALDNILVQTPLGTPFAEDDQLKRLRTAVEDALAGRMRVADRLERRPLSRPRADAFAIQANVLTDNKASNRFTVMEVHARDRPALLHALAYAFFQSRVTIRSAHIATYGERAVDTFYVTDLTGDKIASGRLRALERRLLEAAGGVSEEVAA